MRHAACLLAYKQQHRHSPFWFVLFTTGRGRLKNMAAANVQSVSFSAFPHKLFIGRNSVKVVGMLSFLSRTNVSTSLTARFLSLHVRQKRPKDPLKVRSVAAPAEEVAGFDHMV
ncbi:hypothetical protein SLEP1_g58429 [Rubroshorea leprosula]|uniref:Uncharacterized protein n=1 Tax=Rubroshorea leprosula TaxID=152421 RepID=A0AAV5MPG3_9ROSI|nr:hypothetical protein SLEP1_g58429 [Rubroshorea leprosula]